MNGIELKGWKWANIYGQGFCSLRWEGKITKTTELRKHSLVNRTGYPHGKEWIHTPIAHHAQTTQCESNVRAEAIKICFARLL
jgi:hypothetical protein